MDNRNVVKLRADMIRCVGTRGGIMASHLLVKALQAKDPTDWIYVTLDEWFRDTGLTRNGVNRARGMLHSLKVLSDGFEDDPPIHRYKIDWPRLKAILALSEAQFGDPPHEPNWQEFAPFNIQLDGKTDGWQVRMMRRAGMEIE